MVRRASRQALRGGKLAVLLLKYLVSGPVDSSYTDIHSPLPTYLQVVAQSIIGIIFELSMIATICVGVFTFHHTTACDARKTEHCHDMLVLRAEVATHRA